MGTTKSSGFPGRNQHKMYRLTRGHTKWRVMRMIADGLTQNEIAKHFDVSQAAVATFAKNNAGEIERLKTMVNDEMMALWVASKFNRLASYQQDIEDLDSALISVIAAGAMTSDDVAFIKEKRQILRNVAEELGDLPSRNQVSVQGASVNYTFAGINPNDLQ